MATDFLGKELKDGDPVIFVMSHYRELYKGVIKKINKKKAEISYTNHWNTEDSTWRFYKDLVKLDA